MFKHPQMLFSASKKTFVFRMTKLKYLICNLFKNDKAYP